jgi:WD40 repeat protein
VRLLKTRYQRVDHVEFNATGGLLACGNKDVVFWPNPTGADDSVRVVTGSARSATFVAGDEFIAYCDWNSITLLRLADGSRQPVGIEGDRGDKILSLGGTAFVIHGYRFSLHAFEVTRAGHPRPLWSASPHGFASRPILVSEGEILQYLTGGTLLGRATLSGQEVRNVPVGINVSVFTSPAVSPGFRWLACTLDNQVRVFDPTTPDFRPVRRIDNTDGRIFTGLAFHPSGRFLAATSNDATVKLYDTSNWSLATTYTWDVGRMRSVAFSPDGLLAAAGSDTGKVVVWDVDV